MADLPDLSDEEAAHVRGRLRENVIAWLTTVRPSGQPDSVPVWFLWRDDTVLIYSMPSTQKLRNLERNPRVALALDDTDFGEDVIRIEGTAVHAPQEPAAYEVPDYVRKYGDRIRQIGFDAPESFAGSFSMPIVVTPSRVRV